MAFQPETIMDLLSKLPLKLLQQIVKDYGLNPFNDTKDAIVFEITENRKKIFRSVKYTLSYKQANEN